MAFEMGVREIIITTLVGLIGCGVVSFITYRIGYKDGYFMACYDKIGEKYWAMVNSWSDEDE